MKENETKKKAPVIIGPLLPQLVLGVQKISSKSVVP